MKLLLGIMSILVFWGCGSKNILTLTKKNTLMKKEALIVGVSDYKGAEYDLIGVKSDRLKMKRLFEKWGFHVRVLADKESLNLEKYLKGYDSLEERDAFIFYYSGHGYHVKDTSGDEADGEDEVLVLSDGKKNELFLDDALFGYLNNIKAKKMIFLDSCHSGTAFRSLNSTVKAKNIVASEVSGVMNTRAFRRQKSQIAGGEYIVFSAAKDKEQSLDTQNGGLFTNGFLEQFSNDGESRSFHYIIDDVDKSITKFCHKTNTTPHHPILSVSNHALQYSTINNFFNIRKKISIIPKVLSPKRNHNLVILGQTKFKEHELLKFKIDTKGNRGYLTVFSIEKGKAFVLAKSKKMMRGILNFPTDFDIKLPIECYKSCGSCESELSRVYVVLSSQPLNANLKGLQTTKNQYIVQKDFLIY